GGLEALLGARSFRARFAECFERGARGLVGFGEQRFGAGSAVERFAPRGFGLLDLRDQRTALFGERHWGAFERRALFLRFAMALLQGRDLPGGAGLAAVPFGALGIDGGDAPCAQFGLTGERLRFAARFGEDGAARRDFAARFRKLVF